MARMKGQGSSSQSRLDELKATVGRLRSLGSQYERQVQETRQLLERARLDLDRSGAALSQVVRASIPCDTLLVQLRAGEKNNRESKDLKNYRRCFVNVGVLMVLSLELGP